MEAAAALTDSLPRARRLVSRAGAIPYKATMSSSSRPRPCRVAAPAALCAWCGGTWPRVRKHGRRSQADLRERTGLQSRPQRSCGMAHSAMGETAVVHFCYHYRGHCR